MRKEKPLETKIPVILGIIYGLTVWGRSLLLTSYRVVAVCSYFLVHCSLLPYLSHMDRKKMAWNLAMIIAIVATIGVLVCLCYTAVGQA